MHTACISLTPSESPSPHLQCLRDCFLYHLHHLLYVWTLVIPLPAANSISHHRKEICLIFKYHGATGKALTNMTNTSQHLIPPHSSPSGSQVSEPFVALLGCRAVSFRGRETHAKEISFVCAWRCIFLIKAFAEAFTLLCCFSSPTVLIWGWQYWALHQAILGHLYHLAKSQTSLYINCKENNGKNT